MRLVIDSSAVLYELAAADGLDPVAGAHDLYAPALLWSEATSVINLMAWRDELPDEVSSTMLQRLLDAPIERVTGTSVYEDATDVARRFGWARTYDAEYVGLARSMDASLYTRDSRLSRGVGPFVRTVGPDDL